MTVSLPRPTRRVTRTLPAAPLPVPRPGGWSRLWAFLWHSWNLTALEARRDEARAAMSGLTGPLGERLAQPQPAPRPVRLELP